MGKIARTVHTGGGNVIGYVCKTRFVPSPLCISAAKRNTHCAISCTTKKKKKSIAEGFSWILWNAQNRIVSAASSLSLALSNTHKTTTTLHEFSETCNIITSLCNFCSSCLLLLPPLLTAIIPVICILDLICVVVVWVCDWLQCDTKSPDATWGKKILLHYPWWCLCEILSWFPFCDSLLIPLWQCDLGKVFCCLSYLLFAGVIWPCVK